MSSFKISNNTAYGAIAALMEFNKLDVPVPVAFKAARILGGLKTVAKDIEEAKKILLDRHSEKYPADHETPWAPVLDEFTGQPKIADQKLYEASIDELSEQEVVIDVPSLTEEDLVNLKGIKPWILGNLLWNFDGVDNG